MNLHSFAHISLTISSNLSFLNYFCTCPVPIPLCCQSLCFSLWDTLKFTDTIQLSFRQSLSRACTGESSTTGVANSESISAESQARTSPMLPCIYFLSTVSFRTVKNQLVLGHGFLLWCSSSPWY